MASLTVPSRALVVLIGASGSGKTTFAHRHFAPTQVISSDACRAMICDDENDMECSADAFALVYTLSEFRLKRGKLTIVDSTAVEWRTRDKLLKIADRHRCAKVAIVFEIPEPLCVERDAARGRSVGARVIAEQKTYFEETVRNIRAEGWDEVFVVTPAIQEVLRLTVA